MAKQVREVMTPSVQSASPSQPVAEAAELMKGQDVGSLPVVQEGRLVRILTTVTSWCGRSRSGGIPEQ
jgi:CBS domain-containing protein